MITAVDLFGRSIITGKHKKEVMAANEVAKKIFSMRNEKPWVDELPANPMLEDIEQQVIRVFKENTVGVEWIN